MKLKVKILFDEEVEWKRIAMTYTKILRGDYLDYGFLIVPYSDPKNVVLPKLNFDFPKEEIKKIKNVSKYGTEKMLEDIVWVTEHLKNSNKNYKIPKIDVRKFEQYKGKIENVWKKVEIIFPEISKLNFEFRVYLSNYGTGATVGDLDFDTEEKQILNAYIKADEKYFMSFAADSITNRILIQKSKDVGLSWHEKELVVDFINSQTFISEEIPNFSATINKFARKKVNKKVYEDHREMMEYLRVQDNLTSQIVSGKKFNRKIFTKSELKILDLLIFRSGKVVSYSEISEAVWGEKITEKYSLQALQKMIQRLRNKIDNSPDFPYQVRVSRGRGYFVY